MISCAERQKICQQTRKIFESTDWEDLPIRLHLDRDSGVDYRRRRSQCAYLALQSSLEGDGDYVLLLEDDLDFNRYLSHNLHRWHPLQSRRVTIASLCNPSVRESACDARHNTRIVASHCALGNQAFLISKPTVNYLVGNWNNVHGTLDLKISRLAGRLGRPFLYHAPSLVQRKGKAGPWSEGVHRAVDFDPNWRA
jgi:hypothetical protein